jgi:hypothetical protein
LSGRYWDRTSDLFRVREARSRCANRPKQVLSAEVETGFEPVWTALQAAASPLGHSTAASTSVLVPENRLRADDGTRTRDPHLGKVMRYQLRYVRVRLSTQITTLVESRSNRPTRTVKQGRIYDGCEAVGAIGAVVARFVHTEEVTGSNPVSPTSDPAGGEAVK